VADQFSGPDPTRTVQEDNPEFTVDEMAAEVQRGKVKSPQFFGNQSNSGSYQAFSSAVSMIAGMSSMVSTLKNNIVEQREDNLFRLTEAEYAELRRVARNIASYGNIPQDVVEDFLVIVCSIDNITDMRLVADGVQIPELANESILQQPMEILALRDLRKVAYASSAVEGLVNMFRKYLIAAQNSTEPAENEDPMAMLNSLSSLVSGFTSGFGGLGPRLNNSGVEDTVGHFLTELISGKRVPTSVIAKNPAMQSPSYSGKAFFGEAPTAVSNVDIDQLFNKKLGVFPKPSNGAGTTSFGLQNLGSFGGAMSVTNLLGKMFFGTAEVDPNTKKGRQLDAIVEKVTTITGSSADESIDIRRADTSIPMLQAISACGTNTDKCVFPSNSFSEGWVLSNSVSNDLQTRDPRFMEAVKRFG